MSDVIHIERPGPRTTVQDSGRRGYQHMGFGVAGWIDESCAVLANHLVGNERDAAVLESTLSGPRVRFSAPGQISVVGCAPDVTVNGDRVDPNCTLSVEAGDVLEVRRMGGARAYIGVRGGILTTPILNSRSTDLVGGVGGHHGRALRAGDELRISVLDPVEPRGIHLSFLPQRRSSVEVRCTLGPEAELFTDEALHTLVTSRFTVNAASDGMGLRLDGHPIAAPPQILSEGQAVGSVQIPPSGQPIVLLAGRRTVGGYPKIAIVARPFLSKLAQVIPGDVVVFRMVSLQESVGLTRQWLSALFDPSRSTVPYNA